jgi:hypothetical protein
MLTPTAITPSTIAAPMNDALSPKRVAAMPAGGRIDALAHQASFGHGKTHILAKHSPNMRSAKMAE